ncbi:phosphate ABC transporter permease subunit PstC [Streptomyces rhizosphaerihabitans]|uniref:phosphate ABC transporter permease subunit PstC n=1 Tax=Streptomyces rhizosphaerihabitans TaxID=1266770 RepID=UPI0021BFAAFC|nr:phosphate ABC transporter permease subunit PstC [Streptomyces rhizosphaerihabitans]MCT9007651.1 phosphate ABC transporter permease subunit PstC [Streptomyces rhizosphaerihabitans]
MASAQEESDRPESGRSESGEPASGIPGTGTAEPDRAESDRPEPGRAEPGGAGTEGSGTGEAVPGRPEVQELTPRRLNAARGLGDRVFRYQLTATGIAVLAVMAGVGLFLLLRAGQALRARGFAFLTTAEWQPDVHNFGIAAVMTGTILIALVAVSISVPLAVGAALFISDVAPPGLRRTLVSMVDLMAAVPSVVYGLWGLFFFQQHVIGLSRWLSTWFGWIPLFQVDGAQPGEPLASESVYTASTFIAGIVVALMVAPIQCSVMREVFSQAPAGEREGAYALGATRWGMIRAVVLPYGKGGIIGGTMLGLGRALGETIAVYMIISPVFTIQLHILQTGSNSVSSLIALHYGDASTFGMSALMAAGLALFLLTLAVNFTASSVVARSRSGAQSEA